MSREFLPLLAPVIRCSDSYGLHISRGLANSLLQRDLRNDAASLAVLVVLIVPLLCNSDTSFTRRVTILDRLASTVCYGNCLCRIAGVTVCGLQCFHNAVGDLLAAFIDRQILPLLAPVIRCSDSYGLHVSRGLANSLLQRDLRNNAASLAVLVAVIVPGLVDGNACYFRRVLIRDRAGSTVSDCDLCCSIDRIAVRSRQSFCNAIGDRLTAFVSRQVVPCLAPIVICSDFDWVTDCSLNTFDSLVQLNRRNDAASLTVLVVLIVPDLLDRYRRRSGFIPVRDNRKSRILQVFFGTRERVTFRQFSFFPSICDFLTIRILRQIVDRIRPIVLVR